jgi:hypothetical protein
MARKAAATAMLVLVRRLVTFSCREIPRLNAPH